MSMSKGRSIGQGDKAKEGRPPTHKRMTGQKQQQRGKETQGTVDSLKAVAKARAAQMIKGRDGFKAKAKAEEGPTEKKQKR